MDKCTRNSQKLEELTSAANKGLISKKELQLDSSLLVELLKSVKRLQETSASIFSIAKSDTGNTQKLIDDLQIILENQATKDDPASIFSVANDSDLFASTLFPAAIRTTERLMQIFNLGDPASMDGLGGPRLVSVPLCQYPYLLKSIILTMVSLLMVYRGIGFAYSQHNIKLRQQVQKSHKADVLVDDLARLTVHIDKDFMTAISQKLHESKKSSKLAPLVQVYVKLTDYISASLDPENNTKLKQVQGMFADVLGKFELMSKSVQTKVVRKPLDPDTLSSASDPKITAVDNFISMLTSSSEPGLNDPFNSSIFPSIPVDSISGATGKASGYDMDVHDMFNQEITEASGHVSCIPDFFDKLQNSEDFMCSAEGNEDDVDMDDGMDDDIDDGMDAETGGAAMSSSSSSSSDDEVSDDNRKVVDKKGDKKQDRQSKYSLKCELVRNKSRKYQENEQEKEQQGDAWGDDDDDDIFSAAGSDDKYLQSVLQDLSKEVSSSIDIMTNNLDSAPNTTVTRHVRNAYKKLNSVIRIIIDSLVSTEQTFVTDLLRTQLLDYVNSSGIKNILNDDDDDEDSDDEEEYVESLASLRARIGSLYASKVPMIVFLKENIEQTLDYIRRATAEFAILEAKLISRSLATDAAAQRIYEAMTAEPRCLIQLAVPTVAIPLIYQLNMNHRIVDLYHSIADSISGARVLLQLNSLMIVPIEYYMFAQGVFFDNQKMQTCYKHTYSSVIERMFQYAVTFAGIIYRQQVETSTGVVPAATPTTAIRTSEKMMLKNATSLDKKNVDQNKFEFIKNTPLVDKELAAHPHNYIECLTAFTTGQNINNMTAVSRTGDTASMFMLTNFIYSLDITILLNLIGVQLKLVQDVDRVVELIYSHFEYLLSESGSGGDSEAIPKMFEIPATHLLSVLVVLNPRSEPGATDPMRIADGRLYAILTKLVNQKPKFIKVLEDKYKITVRFAAGEVSVAFSSESSSKTEESEEFTIKPEFFDKMFQPNAAQNLLSHIEMASTKRGETIGEVERPVEYSSLTSPNTGATLVDHLLPKCALLGSFNKLLNMVRLTVVSPSANNLSFQLTPTLYKTSQSHLFKITM